MENMGTSVILFVWRSNLVNISQDFQGTFHNFAEYEASVILYFIDDKWMFAMYFKYEFSLNHPQQPGFSPRQ